MNFSVVWLGLYCAFISTLFEAQARKTNTRLFIKYHRNRENYSPKPDTDCFCFEKQSLDKYVPHQLSAEGHGLVRLVVFFYKDTVTQEVSMYTPNAAKQSLIPDLVYEKNDNITQVTNFKVIDIVGDNPNVTPVKRHEKIDEEIENRSEDSQYSEQFDVNSVPNTDENNNIPVPAENRSEEPHDDVNNVPDTDEGNSLLVSDENRSGEPQYDVIDPQYPNDEQSKENKSDNDGYIEFEMWIGQQMEHVQHGLLHSGSFAILKTLFEKIFLENGMHISSEGFLTDGDGVKINLNNLQLTPILFGSSVRYDQSNISDNTPNLITEVPYLESVLISFINPPKILGIAPLKRVLLPRGKQNYNCNKPNCFGPSIDLQVPTSDDNRNENIMSKELVKLIQKANEKLLKGEILEQAQTSGSIQQFNSTYVKQEVDERQASSTNSPESFKEESILQTEEERVQASEKENEAPSLTTSIEVSEKETDKASAENSFVVGFDTKQINRKKNMGNILNSIIKQLSKVVLKEEEEPGFRIIGGSAATGSGSPLSNKGRRTFSPWSG